MAQNKRRRISGDLAEYILLILLKEGAQTLQQLQEKTALQTVGFHSHERHVPHDEVRGVEVTCEGMVCRRWIAPTKDAKYDLTDEGRVKAQETAQDMERGARILETHFLSPSATARNTTISYVFLAAVKMVAGFFSGSVGLIADGADTSVDTAASAIVWAGIKFKKEIICTVLTIGLMFITAVVLFFDSITSILENIAGLFTVMSAPYVVIAVELLAMFSMFVVSLYQRFVGKRSQSLALISQSVDSKNSVYSSAAVIVGAIFAIFGVHWVDAVVGGFIAVRITLDGLDLSREAIKLSQGKQPEFSKFRLPFEKQIGQRRTENFRNWILYAIHDEKLTSKQELVASLETTFRPSYMPAVFNEFTVGRGVDFNADFSDLMKPLLDEAYIAEANGAYNITGKGKDYIKDTVGSLRYKQTKH